MNPKMVEQLNERMKLIMQDMKDDAKNFDGEAFNGQTVARYLAYQGAAIAALADTLGYVLTEIKED